MSRVQTQASHQQSGRPRRELHVMVICEWDTARKYRVILRGNLDKLEVRKLKGYIHDRTGVAPEDQTLILDGRIIDINARVGSVGLYPDANIILRHNNLPKAPAANPQKYYSPSESDVESRQFSSKASYSQHGGKPHNVGRLGHYPLPYDQEDEPSPPHPDHIGRMRQYEEEMRQLEAMIPPNPSYVNELHAGRNDLHAMQERLALERERFMSEQVEAFRATVCGKMTPDAYDERKQRMLGPSRTELMEQVRILEAQRDEAIGVNAVQGAHIQSQHFEMNEIRHTLNGQRDVINAQRPFVVAASPRRKHSMIHQLSR